MRDRCEAAAIPAGKKERRLGGDPNASLAWSRVCHPICPRVGACCWHGVKSQTRSAVWTKPDEAEQAEQADEARCSPDESQDEAGERGWHRKNKIGLWGEHSSSLSGGASSTGPLHASGSRDGGKQRRGMRTEESVVLRLRPTRRLARPHPKRQSSWCDQSQPLCPNKKETAAFPQKFRFHRAKKARIKGFNRERSKWHLRSRSLAPTLSRHRNHAFSPSVFLGNSLRGIGFS